MKTETITWHELPADGMPDAETTVGAAAGVNAARKFRRQRTAEFRALDMREARRGDWRAVEHGFDDSKTPNV